MVCFICCIVILVDFGLSLLFEVILQCAPSLPLGPSTRGRGPSLPHPSGESSVEPRCRRGRWRTKRSWSSFSVNCGLSIPPPPHSRVPLASDVAATLNPGNLFCIRKELVRSKKISPEDCFPVRRSDRFDGPLMKLSFAKDIWGRGGEKDSYSAVLKRDSMAEGGRWVWQPEPRRPVQQCPPRPSPPRYPPQPL